MSTSDVQERTTAEAALRLLRRERGMALPRRPRFVRGVAVIPVSGGFVFEGGPEPVVLRGATAGSLPKLIAMLDGSRDVDGLARSMDLPVDQVEQILALLYTKGLLEEPPAEPWTELAPIGPAATLDSLYYLSRMRSSTGARSSAEEAAAALARLRAALVVAGPRRPEPALRNWLTASGVSVVDRNGAAEAAAQGAVLVSLCAEPTPDEEAAAEHVVAELAARARVDWLRIAVRGGDTIEVGPYFEPGQEPCHACFLAQRSPLGSDRPAASELDLALAVDLAAALGLAELQVRATRVGHSQVHPGYVEVNLATGEQRQHTVARLCPCPETLERPPAPSLAQLYAATVAPPPLAVREPNQRLAHYRPAVAALTREHAHEYPTSPSVGLTTVTEGELRPGPLDLTRLGALLTRTAGLRQGADGATVRRWAPTGGNLGSVQAFVVVFELDGVQPGFYHYHAAEHVLYRTSTDAPVAGTARHAALLVLTAALDKVRRKYGRFAVKLAHQDAGVALLQAHVAAARYGLRLTEVGPADLPQVPDLSRALLVDPDREPIIAVLAMEPAAR